MENQLELISNFLSSGSKAIKSQRFGTFADNMSLPIHRWFRFSAGFSAEWVKQIVEEINIQNPVILDPFAGSGTVSVVCDSLGIESFGIEAHPFISRIANGKLLWDSSIEDFHRFSNEVLNYALCINNERAEYPELILRSYDSETLQQLDNLKKAWLYLNDQSASSELSWLAITAILRQTSRAGTAQWQYILPSKEKKKVASPLHAFSQQISIIENDMRMMQNFSQTSKAKIITGDSRLLTNLIDANVDIVITSPPYANNYDYADSMRFEMTFWGEVNSWGDLYEKARKYLIVSSSQHSAHEKIDLESILNNDLVIAIRQELTDVTQKLAEARNLHGGHKTYHTMIAAYCRDISLVLIELRKKCVNGSEMFWMIGDSAPYGVYCPIDKWIGELALSAGFKDYEFQKLRDRNIKWKNRKHRVPLKEGILHIKG